MEIKTQRGRGEEITEEEEEEEEPLSPTARLFHAPEVNCYVMAVIGSNRKIDVDVIIQGLKETLIKHPRFSTKLVTDKNNKGKQKWVKTNVIVENHVIIPKFKTQPQNANAFLEDYISNLTTISLDTSKPLWELHLFNLKTSNAENVAVFKLHHSLGDGMSLMSLVLACTRKTSNPNEIPSLPYQDRSRSGLNRLLATLSWLISGLRSNYRLRWILKSVLWPTVILILNTVCDVLKFIATVLFLKDTETPIKGDFGIKKIKRLCLVHRIVDLDDIKVIKNIMKITVNDVVLGVTEASLSQYLKRRYEEKKKLGEKVSRWKSNDLPRRIRLRAGLLINLRPTTKIQDLADLMSKGSKCRWGNQIGYIIYPFSIAIHDDPLEYLRRAKSTIDKKKNSFEGIITFIMSKIIVNFFGVKVAANIMKKTMSNTTMSFSNTIGPIEEISFYGHPITYIAPSVYGHPQALTIHFQSYMNKMAISLTVDPTVISDPHQLCDDWEESLKNIKVAVQSRSFTE